MSKEKKKSPIKTVLGLIIVALLIPLFTVSSVKRFFKKKFSTIE